MNVQVKKVPDLKSVCFVMKSDLYTKTHMNDLLEEELRDWEVFRKMTNVLNGEWFKEYKYNPFGRPMTLKKGQTVEASGILYHLADSKLFRIPAGYPEGVK